MVKADTKQMEEFFESLKEVGYMDQKLRKLYISRDKTLRLTDHMGILKPWTDHFD